MAGAIIQARMGASRLPGKVLKEVNGVPLLKFQVERVNHAETVDKIIVATSSAPQDEAIADFCKKNDIECFRGDENDVLARYYECATHYGVETIVRLTGDCPLIDPVIIDETIRLLKENDIDYAANTVPPETSLYPDGSDVEVFSMQALERAHRECKDAHDREHVTFYFWKYNNDFRNLQLTHDKDYSKYRFTVDYPEDLKVIDFIIKELSIRKQFGYLNELIKILDDNPQVKEQNAQYYFGIGWKQ